MATRTSPIATATPVIPNSPRGLLESCGSARTWWTSRRWTRDMSEHSEPIYYRPIPRPQAATPPSSRCAMRFSSASTCSSRLWPSVASCTAAKAAAAAGAAREPGLRRVRCLRCGARPGAKGSGARRPYGGTRWSRGVERENVHFAWISDVRVCTSLCESSPYVRLVHHSRGLV